MLTRVAPLFIVLAATIGMACDPRTKPACHAPDAVSSAYIGVVRGALADKNSRRFWRLPDVNPSEVRPVTDPKVCVEARRAMAPLWGKREQEPLIVIQLGPAYAVVDEKTGVDADGLYYFASDWSFLSNGFVQ